ncbi:heme NO-binding domain-containing protein [Novosphingobium sp.]|uniref:heme NO-binding domain-containing protein n=1 Tax=Novosphingobium sp. TaxID=1874826 RepID=UPI00334103C8
MYGLIHRAMRAMVTETLGDQAWQTIETGQGIGPGELISLSIYDDALTMQLMAAVSEALQLTMEQTLRRFGAYWIAFVSKGAYSAIVNFTGRDLPTLLRNLNRMHQTVRATMPEALVPSFTVVTEFKGRICVEYRSTRTGLEPMVIGLLEGLIRHFGLTGQVKPGYASSEASQYLITYSDA